MRLAEIVSEVKQSEEWEEVWLTEEAFLKRMEEVCKCYGKE